MTTQEEKLQQKTEETDVLDSTSDTPPVSEGQTAEPPCAPVCSTGKCRLVTFPTVLVLLIVVLLIGATEYGLYATSGRNYIPANDLPQGAAVYIELNAPWNSSELGTILDSDAMLWLCKSDDGPNTLAQIRAMYADFVDHRFNSVPGKMLKGFFGFEPSSYLGARTGIAVYSLKGKTPDIVVATSMSLPILAAGLERAMSFLPKGATWKKQTAGSVANPVTLFEVTFSAGTKVYVLSRNNNLIAATSYTRIENMLSDEFRPLSTETGFASLKNWDHKDAVGFLFSPQMFVDEIVGKFSEDSTAGSAWKYFNKLFNKIAFDSFSYSFIELHVKMTGHGSKGVEISGSLIAPLDPDKSDLVRLEPAEITDFDAAKVLPADAFLTLCWSKNVPNLWQSILKDQSPEELEKIKADPASKVFEETFFPAMATVHTISLTPQTPDPRFQQNFPFPSLVLCLGLKDMKTFSDIVYDQVDKFMEDLRADHEKSGEPIPFFDRRLNHKGIEINYFEIPENPVKDAIVPSYAFMSNYWIISTSIEGIKKCIDVERDGKSLYNAPAFRVADRAQLPASGWIYTDPSSLSMEFNTNATAWNENLLKIGPEDIPLPELRYRPHEQAQYQNQLRVEQLIRKKALDRLCSALYNFAPSMAVYRESRERLEWSFDIILR